MKTKTSTDKLARLLNKVTVANLNQLEMVGIKGGDNFHQENGLVSLVVTAVCTEEAGGCAPYNPDEPLFPALTFLPSRCGACE
jgi:hypothetical protein